MNEEHEIIGAPKWALVFSATCAFIISIVGCVCNLLTILALPYSPKLRNAATWLIMNLALTEMVFCASILPLSASHLLYIIRHDMSFFTSYGCKFFVFLRYVIIMTEVFDIAAIALNRVILIAYPRKYHKIFNKVNTLAIIIGIWIGSILMMCLPLFSVFGSFDYNSYTSECDFEEGSKTARKVYLIFGFVLPCLVIIASYSYIFYKARQSTARVHSRLDQTTNPYKPATGLRNRDMRIARVIAVIFLVFIVCCTPVSIGHYYGSQGQFPTLLLLLHPLYWLQYCLNMFIYVLMNKQYREAYINYLAVWWPNIRTLTAKFEQGEDEETAHSLKRLERHQEAAGSPNNNQQKEELTPKATGQDTPDYKPLAGERDPENKNKIKLHDLKMELNENIKKPTNQSQENYSQIEKSIKISGMRKIFLNKSFSTSSAGSN